MIDLFLLPGLLNDARLWQHQAEALSDLARIHVPDLTQDNRLAAMSQRILDQAPERFAVAGLSMGGYVALDLVRRAPERIVKLGLISTNALPDMPDAQERRREAIALAQRGGFSKIMPTMLPNLVHPDHMMRVGGLVKNMAKAVGVDGFINQQEAIMTRPDARPALPRVPCPTLIVVGEDDISSPPVRAYDMESLIPNSWVVEIPHCGHLSALEQPDAVAAAMRDWLLR